MSALEAVVDIGTNSALLLIAQRDQEGVWQTRLQREAICRLGKGIGQGAPIAPDAVGRLREALTEFRATLALTGARLRAVGMTESVRVAKNPEVAFAVVNEILGVIPRVLSGEEEARLVRKAVLSLYPEPPRMVVVDMGGGSLEVDSGRKSWSMPLGAVRVFEQFPKAPREQIIKHVRAVFKEHGLRRSAFVGSQLVVVGGTATTLAAMELGMREYDGSRLEGMALPLELFDRWQAKLDTLPTALRARLPGVSAGRADILPTGLAVLRFTLEFLKADTIRVTDRGLRWGLLLEALES
jgi:exopolyphosphatase / guanosine-5'-triphosphate,3'-diphosphate pyrophosphatase